MSKRRLKAEIEAENAVLHEAVRTLLRGGEQASNVCFNLRQQPGRELDSRDCSSMEMSYRAWDRACANVREALRGKGDK